MIHGHWHFSPGGFPELDIKLITTATGNTHERARIVAKFLKLREGRIFPLEFGIPLEGSPCYQSESVKGYDFEKYPGKILANGIQAIIDWINTSSEETVVLGIAPLPNLAAVLMQDPSIVNRSRFIGMFGSIHKGYFGSGDVAAESNVKLYPYSCREVFSSQWNKTITPLDTCGIVQLKGEKYQSIRGSNDVLVQAIMENYDCWTKYNKNPLYNGFDPQTESSILYDLVPIYLAFSSSFLNVSELGITVTDDGYTIINEQGGKIHCALTWHDLQAFENLVVSRITGC